MTPIRGKPAYAKDPPGYKPDEGDRYGDIEKVGRKIIGANDYRADAPKKLPDDIQTRNNESRARFIGSGAEQRELAEHVRDRAMGRGGPSVAELQMKRGLGMAQQQAASRAAAGRGMGRGAAQRMAMREGSALAGQANEQAGMLRAQEQIGAQQLAGQQLRDYRQQELLALGYNLEEAKALIAAETAAQQTNAQITEGEAGRGQGPAALAAGAVGGLFALSDVRAKEVDSYGLGSPLGGSRGMPSDFSGKEQVAPIFEPAIPQRPMGSPSAAESRYLQVQETPNWDAGVEKQQERMNAFGMGQQAGNAATGGNFGQSATAGFNIASMLSDEKAKELVEENSVLRRVAGVVSGGAAGGMAKLRSQQAPPAPSYGAPPQSSPMAPGYGAPPMMSDFSSKELDDMAQQATAFGGPSQTTVTAEESRRDMAPVQPVGYQYKPEDSARMANEATDLAEMRSRYSGMGELEDEEEKAIATGTYADKRAPRKGIIAQDLQKSPAFRDSVITGPAGLMVQKDRALSTALGELAGMDKRLRQLEDIGNEQELKIRRPNKNQRAAPRTDRYSGYLNDDR